MQKITIVAFGDSTTAFRDTVSEVYSQRLERKLVHGNPALKIINSGVQKSDTNRAEKRFSEDVMNHNPDIIIIQFGINDSAIDVPEGKSSPRVSLDRYTRNLEYFIKELEKSNASIILMTPNPLRWTAETKETYGYPPYDSESTRGFNILLDDYVGKVKKIANENNMTCIDINQAFEGKEPEDLLLDGMHPNDRGHELISELLFPHIKNLIVKIH